MGNSDNRSIPLRRTHGSILFESITVDHPQLSYRGDQLVFQYPYGRNLSKGYFSLDISPGWEIFPLKLVRLVNDEEWTRD